MTASMIDGFARSVTVVKALEAARTGPAAWRRDPVEEAFESLRPITGYDMGSLSYWDAEAGTHRTVVNAGYPDHVVALCDSVIHTDTTFQWLRARHTPLRLRGLPEQLLSGPVGTQIIERHSFQDGLTHCFFTRSGRYLGYINLTASAGDLDDATFHLVQLIESAVSPLLESAVRASQSERRASADEHSPLTARETEVLSHLPSGATNAEIAGALCVSPTTVARHIEHIIAKLGVPNRTRAACVAVEWGLNRPGIAREDRSSQYAPAHVPQ